MAHNKQRSKSLREVLSFSCAPLLIGVPLLCVILVVGSMVYSDIRDRRYANLLYNYPLPPQTEVLDHEKTCFCPPNGGTCAMQFSETMATLISQEQVEEYYSDVRFPPLRKKPIDIVPIEYQMAHVHLDFDYPGQSDGRMVFKASIGEPFYIGGFLDFRCDQ